MEWPVRLIAIAGIAALLYLGACQEGTNPGEGLDPPVESCIDHDNDSYGVNCEAGFDCDDDDPEIWADCHPDNPCATPRTGCPCELEGEEIACRTATPIVSDDGSELCYAGVRTCREGVWSRCESLYAYEPGTEGDVGDDGVHREPLIRYGQNCLGSCDTGCTRIHDCPSQPDFVGDVYHNIRYDIGRTIGEGDDAMAVPPGTILMENTLEGWFVRTIGEVCPGDQTVQWWAVDFEEPIMPPPGEGQVAHLEVRAAASEEDLDDRPWQSLLLCPEVGDGGATCTPPEHPFDRQFVEDANLFRRLGDDARQPWIQFRVRLTRESADIPSPRFMSYDLYYFCGEAS